MIFILFKEGQGLGNQLFLYLFAKTKAEELGKDFCVADLKNFKGKSFIKLSFDYQCSKENIPEDVVCFDERSYYDSKFDAFAYFFDQRVAEISDNSLISGIYQAEKYYDNLSYHARRLITYSFSQKNNDIDLSKTCVLNIRGGEYRDNKELVLPKKYWVNAMKFISNKYPEIERFVITTDDPNYAKSILPHLEIISCDIESSYQPLLFYKYYIISNSSFSLIPLHQNLNKPFVIAPLLWSRYENKRNIWMSPANYYKKFKWFDGEKIVPSKRAIELITNTVNYYESRLNVLCENRDLETKFNLIRLIKKSIPVSLKTPLKKILYFVGIR